MSEPTEPVPQTPEEIAAAVAAAAAASLLAHNKKITLELIVSHMNSVGSGIVNSYPMAEVQSWTIQRTEAETLLAVTEAGVLAMTDAQMQGEAPFLYAVCAAHYGPADAAPRAAQLWAKAQEVKANADLWSALSAFVNGLRARAADRVAAAESVAEVYEIESEIQTELSGFRDAYKV